VAVETEDVAGVDVTVAPTTLGVGGVVSSLFTLVLIARLSHSFACRLL